MGVLVKEITRQSMCKISQPGGGGTNFQGGGANLSFGQIFTKNYMKMKEFGPSAEGARVPGALP